MSSLSIKTISDRDYTKVPLTINTNHLKQPKSKTNAELNSAVTSCKQYLDHLDSFITFISILLRILAQVFYLVKRPKYTMITD